MREIKHRPGITDLIFILFFAVAAALLIFFAAPGGREEQVTFTVTYDQTQPAVLSEGDELIVLSGGTLGRVTYTGEGFAEVAAEAERRGGEFYSGAVLLRDGREYTVCSGAVKFTCTLHRIKRGTS